MQAHKDMTTVVMTCYNEGERLLSAYASLEAQNDQEFEVIIVNDASSDPKTNDLLRQLEQERRARVLWRRSNGGPARAKNHGVREALGEIVVPLDADDSLPPDAVAAIKEAFRRHRDAGYVFGDYLYRELYDGTEKLVDCSILCDSNGLLDPRRLTTGWCLLGTSPCRKSVWQSVGGHAEEFSYDAHDVDFFLRLARRGVRGYYLAKTIYCWNRASTGINSNLPPDTLLRLYVANLAFYDKFGDGMAVRRHCLDEALKASNFQVAHKLARQLLLRGVRSRQIGALAFCPPRLYPRMRAVSQAWRKRIERARATV